MWDLLDAAGDWLNSQPKMRPWPRGRKRLVAQIDRWIARYAAAACGRRLEPAEPLYAACTARLWRCWEHHWRQAAELAGGRADGFQVAACLEQGLGFRGGRQLGGNPLEDVVLAAAVCQRDPAAIERFSERFRGRVLALATQTHPGIADPDDWWCRLMVHLAGVGGSAGKLVQYEGRCGLWNWLARVVIRFRPDPVPQLPGQRRALETIAAPAADGAEDRECLELLGGLVRQAVEQLPPEQATLLYLVHVEGLSGKAVAAVLGVHPGTISRRRGDAAQELRNALASLDARSVQGRGYQDCLEILSHRRNLRELGDVFLGALGPAHSAEDALTQEPDG